MSSKHTPLPWSLKTFSDGAFILTEGTDVDDPKYCVIASRNEHDRPEESIANARLIANAPKMYKSLKEIQKIQKDQAMFSPSGKSVSLNIATKVLDEIDNPKD